MRVCACECCHCDTECCEVPTAEELAAERKREMEHERWLWTPARSVFEQVDRDIHFATKQMAQVLAERLHAGPPPGGYKISGLGDQ